MIEYLYGEEAELVPWAEARLDGEVFRDDAKTIGMASDGKVRAVVVYDTFSPRNCFVAVATDQQWGWFTREFAVRSMAFPFIQCGFPRISCYVSVFNGRSSKFISGFGGWRREGRAREAGAKGEDLILWGMLRRNCRWLPPDQRYATLPNAVAAV